VPNKLVEAANARLKAGKTGIAIEVKGDRLTLRATLPPKPNSDKTKPYQQRIYLSWYANPAGIKHAEAEARQVSSDLALDRFDWTRFQDVEVQTEVMPRVDNLIGQFKADKFIQGISDRTWKDDYTEVFDYLTPVGSGHLVCLQPMVFVLVSCSHLISMTCLRVTSIYPVIPAEISRESPN
jgi:hypothetical protein